MRINSKLSSPFSKTLRRFLVIIACVKALQPLQVNTLTGLLFALGTTTTTKERKPWVKDVFWWTAYQKSADVRVVFNEIWMPMSTIKKNRVCWIVKLRCVRQQQFTWRRVNKVNLLVICYSGISSKTFRVCFSFTDYTIIQHPTSFNTQTSAIW